MIDISSESLVYLKQEQFKAVLESAREYYESCNFLGEEPKEGLQKVVYDLGKEVRDPSVKNLRRRSRKLREYAEVAKNLSKMGYF